MPTGWESLPEEGHTYRRSGVNGGRLCISVHPPHPEWALGGALLARLRQMLADMGEDVGEEMTALKAIPRLVRRPRGLHRSPERGLTILAGRGRDDCVRLLHHG